MPKSLAVAFGVFLLLGTAEMLALAAPPLLSISWVSVDRALFDTEKGEKVALRFRVSAPGNVTVRWIDQSDRPVRRMSLAVREPGEQTVVWDGKDDAGSPVPAEAYVYTITAQSVGAQPIASEKPGVMNHAPTSSKIASAATGETAPSSLPSPSKGEGQGGGDPDSPIHPLTDSPDLITYDLRARTGGETVWPTGQAMNAAADGARISYSLPRAARVRLIVTRKDTTWPVRTLIDWAPREAGRHEEEWNGWDAGWFVNALKTPDLVPILYAFALPENAVIVKGDPAARTESGVMNHAPTLGKTPSTGKAAFSSFPSPSKGEGQGGGDPDSPIHPFTASPSSRPLHVHARHPRERCYNPEITVSLPDVTQFAAASPYSSPSVKEAAFLPVLSASTGEAAPSLFPSASTGENVPTSLPSPLKGEGQGGGDRVGASRLGGTPELNVGVPPRRDVRPDDEGRPRRGAPTERGTNVGAARWVAHGGPAPAVLAGLSPDVPRGPAPVPKITRPTPIRFDIAREQPPGKEAPIPRVSVFIYVDGVMVERFLVGYMPFNWIIDPARLSPGEHVITGLFAWRDDHFGIAHVRIWVEKEQQTAKR